MPVLAAGCATGTSYNRALLPEPERPRPNEIEATVFLIGDAGEPDPALLEALTEDASQSAADTVRPRILFLGDNIYEAGLPAERDPDYPKARRRLNALLEVARESEAVGLFVLGNHDWADGKLEGWERALLQGEYVDRNGGIMLPKGGCFGPAVHDVGARLRLVLLDTDWWLHDGPKPSEAARTFSDSPCRAVTQHGVIQNLRAVLAESQAAGREVVVAAPHPLMTGGRHGGYWTFSDHFLLPGVLRWLHTVPAVALAGVGLALGEEWLLAPALLVQFGPPLIRVRRIGFSQHQDLRDSWYSALRDSLRNVLAEHPPRAYAAGHEHNLQVIEGGPEGYTLLSGAGSPDKLTAAKIIQGTLCKEVKPGYMRLDFLRGAERRVLLTVLVDDAGDRQVRETCRMYLGKRR